jgi:hypothetical protein
MRKEVVVDYFGNFSGENEGKHEKNFTQDRRYPDRESNRALPEYKPQALQLQTNSYI